MGSWGIKATQSDAGCDAMGMIADLYKDKTEINLNDIFLDEDFFPKDTSKDIDYYYDMSAMAITEIYLEFKETNKIEYQGLTHIKTIIADKKAINFLLQMLYDIRDEKPDEDGERELVELWKESKLWEKWKAHLLDLISRLEIGK